VRKPAARIKVDLDLGPGRLGGEGMKANRAAWEEGSRLSGGLEEEAKGGGGSPSPAADEELQRRELSIGVRRLSLSIDGRGEWSIGMPVNLNCLVSLSPIPNFFRFPLATMEAWTLEHRFFFRLAWLRRAEAHA
jgi:hypothetical protein